MELHTRTVGSETLGDCPAAVVAERDGGHAVILVNSDAFGRLRRPEQRFILAHELGHLLLDTDSEELADAFALGLTAGRQHRSLKSALSAVASMRVVPHSRLEHLYSLCLAVDRQPKQ